MSAESLKACETLIAHHLDAEGLAALAQHLEELRQIEFDLDLREGDLETAIEALDAVTLAHGHVRNQIAELFAVQRHDALAGAGGYDDPTGQESAFDKWKAKHEANEAARVAQAAKRAAIVRPTE